MFPKLSSDTHHRFLTCLGYKFQQGREVVQGEHERGKTHDQCDGEANRKYIELGCAARQDAEREVGDEQGTDKDRKSVV